MIASPSVQRSNGHPAPYLNPASSVVVAPAADEHSGIRAVKFTPGIQTAHHVRGNRLARFDFDRVKLLFDI